MLNIHKVQRAHRHYILSLKLPSKVMKTVGEIAVKQFKSNILCHNLIGDMFARQTI